MNYRRNNAGPVLRLRNRLDGLAVVVLHAERGGRNLKGGPVCHNPSCAKGRIARLFPLSRISASAGIDGGVSQRTDSLSGLVTVA